MALLQQLSRDNHIPVLYLTYDTQTGEIYRAYSGFNDLGSDRYLPVSDDMYTLPVAGYITK